jgi:hypothetical protein
LAVVAPIFLFVETKMEYKTLVISYSNLNTKMVSLNLNTNVANSDISKGSI